MFSFLDGTFPMRFKPVVITYTGRMLWGNSSERAVRRATRHLLQTHEEQRTRFRGYAQRYLEPGEVITAEAFGLIQKFLPPYKDGFEHTQSEPAPGMLFTTSQNHTLICFTYRSESNKPGEVLLFGKRWPYTAALHIEHRISETPFEEGGYPEPFNTYLILNGDTRITRLPTVEAQNIKSSIWPE